MRERELGASAPKTQSQKEVRVHYKSRINVEATTAKSADGMAVVSKDRRNMAKGSPVIAEAARRTGRTPSDCSNISSRV